MAKKSIVNKNKKTAEMAKRFYSVRKKFKESLRYDDLSFDEILLKRDFLRKTRRASLIRYRNRCFMTGRPRGFRGYFGLSRGALRYYASFGMIAGVRKG